MNYYLKVLQNYANFNGRARRAEYWYFFLFNMIAAVIVGFIAGLIDFAVLGNIYTLAVLLPSIAVGVRRMHDVGKSGWYLLIPIYSFILAVTAGDVGENEYGPDPKEQSSSDLLD
ncbi:MAG: putative cytochrome [Bacteroidota bacterium]